MRGEKGLLAVAVCKPVFGLWEIDYEPVAIDECVDHGKAIC